MGVRELLVEVLEGRGLQVASAADGAHAVAALEGSAGCCRLVFADISLPGADGFEVLTAARRSNPSAFVVMITGYGSLETAVNAVRLGAQDYLTKPFSLDRVDAVLGRAAALHQLHRERGTVQPVSDAGQRADTTDSMAAVLGSIDGRLAALEHQVKSLAQRGPA